MNTLRGDSILVVADRSPADSELLVKATRLAHGWGAKLELFLCDAEHAYALEHAYEQSGAETIRQRCITDATDYLSRLKSSVTDRDLSVCVDSSCDSPLYEGIVRKVLASRPALVMKSAAGMDRRGCATVDANDWQLMRACPVTLMLTRGRRWSQKPRFLAAVDVSGEETEGLAKLILQSAESMALAEDGELEVVYAEASGADEAAVRAHVAAMDCLVRRSHLKKPDVHILAGDPEQTLSAFAGKRDYDVLVLGALTHRQGLTALVGTLTSKLVDTLDCDFALIKPDAYRSPVSRWPIRGR